MIGFNGGLIGAERTASTATGAAGVWTLPEQVVAKSAGRWPGSWTPANITTALWLDAADSSTVTESSGLVSQVNDKSGNGRNFTASGGARPTYTSNALNGLPVFTYSGSQWLTSASAASTWNFLHNANGSTVVAVWKAGNSSDPNEAYSLCGSSSNASTSVGCWLFFEDRASLPANEKFRCLVYRGVSLSFVISNDSSDGAHPPNAPVLLSSVSSPSASPAASRSSIRVNGGASIANNTQTNPVSTGNATYALQVGAAGNNTFPMTGYVAELVILASVASDATRQLIEGYLAHKWGLAANLPTDHPYKAYGP